MFVQFGHKRIGIKLLYVEHARFLPGPLQVHHGTNHTGHTSSVAHRLRTGLLIGHLVAAVVVNVVSLFLPVFKSLDAATDGSPALIVLAQITRVRQYSLQKLNGYNLHPRSEERRVGKECRSRWSLC